MLLGQDPGTQAVVCLRQQKGSHLNASPIQQTAGHFDPKRPTQINAMHRGMRLLPCKDMSTGDPGARETLIIGG